MEFFYLGPDIFGGKRFTELWKELLQEALVIVTDGNTVQADQSFLVYKLKLL